MRPVERPHPAFVRALRRIARRDVGAAEAHRRLIPVAIRLGLPRPSYWRVRDLLLEERLRAEHRAEIRARVLTQVAMGRFPRPQDFAP